MPGDPGEIDMELFAEDRDRAVLEAMARLMSEQVEHPERYESVTNDMTGEVRIWRRKDAPS